MANRAQPPSSRFDESGEFSTGRRNTPGDEKLAPMTNSQKMFDLGGRRIIDLPQSGTTEDPALRPSLFRGGTSGGAEDSTLAAQQGGSTG
jgi:hypothetical protein